MAIRQKVDERVGPQIEGAGKRWGILSLLSCENQCDSLCAFLSIEGGRGVQWFREQLNLASYPYRNRTDQRVRRENVIFLSPSLQKLSEFQSGSSLSLCFEIICGPTRGGQVRRAQSSCHQSTAQTQLFKNSGWSLSFTVNENIPSAFGQEYLEMLKMCVWKEKV